MKFYHATFAAKAQKIIHTRKLCSRAKPYVYVTNTPKVRDAYGDGTVLEVTLAPGLTVELDDEFSSGRKDYRIATRRDKCVPLLDAKIVRKQTKWWRSRTSASPRGA